MADDRRRSSGFGFKFFLFLVYVAAYGFLRYQGEIIVQQIALPAPGGGTEVFRMVGSHPDLPHWRQQLWRAVFSFAMVGEEEGRRLMNQGMNTYRGANAPGGQNYGGQQNAYPGGQAMYSGGQQQVVYSSAPVYPAGASASQGAYQQQRAYPSSAGQNAYAAPQNPSANPGERVIWDGRNQSVQELPANVRRPLSAVATKKSDANAVVSASEKIASEELAAGTSASNNLSSEKQAQQAAN